MRVLLFATCLALVPVCVTTALADEIWVAPTSQADFGGLEIGTNTFWPVTPIGVVRLAWAVPNNLQAFQGAKVVLIPGTPGGAANVNIFVCAAQNGNPVAGSCAGPFAQGFTGVANQLVEVEIGPSIASQIGTPGANYLAVLAYTTPTTTTDHIVGLRFAYTATAPGGAATLGANTFSGTQTAPAFVGSGAGLTDLPVPAGVATLGANTFSGSQTAPAFFGSGAGLTSLPFPAGAATLGANTFAGTQTIDTGNLDLDPSTATTGNLTKNGARFLHNFGTNNTFLGVSAGNLSMTGLGKNVAVGFTALSANTTGDSNTAIGHQALLSNAGGSGNTANGANALSSNSSGVGNTASGFLSLTFNSTGGSNTANGYFALGSNSTGNQNTASGTGALLTNSSGSSNTAIGSGALSNATGSSNVALGFSAGLNSTSGSNNIYVGAGINGLAGESNTMYLGKQGTQNKAFVAGIRGITTGVADAIPVVIDSSGQLGTVSSSIRFKEDVRDMADASRRLLRLRPVTFRYTQAYINGAKPIQYGLVAEEVAEVFPELAVRGPDGQVETVHYETLNVLLLNELQKQVRRNEQQEQLNDEQQQRIEALEQKLHALLDGR